MAALLEAIGRTASLRVAAEELGMSCMNAWGLVKTMYDGLREPLVALSRGGAGHGGARVTEFGEEVLALHGEMEAEALRALDGRWRRIRRLVS
jgi:molybdate transport system regulatory protein